MKLTLSPIRIKGIILPVLILLGISQTALAYDCVMPKKSEIAGKYDSNECIFDGLIKISKNGKYGAMDNVGIVIVPLMFDEIGEFHNGVARVRYQGRYGFMNGHGILVIPIQYDDAGFFQNGKTLVRQEDEYFMINIQGWRVLDDKPAMPLSQASDLPSQHLTHILLSDPTVPEPMN